MERSIQIGASITPQLKEALDNESAKTGVSLSTIVYKILLSHYGMEENNLTKKSQVGEELISCREQILRALPVDQFFSITQICELIKNTSHKVEQVLDNYPSYFQIVDTPKGVRVRRLSRRERREQREIQAHGLKLANRLAPQYNDSERRLQVVLNESTLLTLWAEHKLSQICTPREILKPKNMEEVLRDSPKRITPEEYLELIKPLEELYKEQNTWV